MDSNEIQKQCSEFLQRLGVPGFVVFGWEKKDGQYGVVYSSQKMPPNVAVKGMTWALHDFASKKL